jgi:hypothetical protein
MNTETPEVANQLKQLRIVIGAMTFGVTSFAVVVVFVGGAISRDASLGWVLAGALGMLGAAELAAYPLIRAALLRSARVRYEQGSSGDAAIPQVVRSFFTVTLIRAAMAEGFGLAGLGFLLVTGLQPLWFAPAISIAFLLATMPNQETVSAFIDEVTGSNRYGC